MSICDVCTDEEFLKLQVDFLEQGQNVKYIRNCRVNTN